MIEDIDYTLKIKEQSTFKEFHIASKKKHLFSFNSILMTIGLGIFYYHFIYSDKAQYIDITHMDIDIFQFNQGQSHFVNIASIMYSFFFFFFISFLFYLKGSLMIVKESMIIMKDTGIQLSKKNMFGKKSTQFFDLSKFREIIIHEKLNPYDVYYYMALIMNKDQKIIIPFRNFKPQIKTLLKIYHQSKKLLDSRKKI